MELTVIRVHDRQRMVVSVDAAGEREALHLIENAVGAVIVTADSALARRGPVFPIDRHARRSSYF